MNLIKKYDVEPINPHPHMKSYRLHSKNNGCSDFGMSLSYYEPGGSSGFDKPFAEIEMVYFIVDGEMTVITETERFVMAKGDSVHFMPTEARELRNDSANEAVMLLIASNQIKE